MKRSVILIAFIILCAFVISGLFFTDKNKKNLTIKFSSWGTKSEVEVIKSVIRKYEEDNPGIKVEFIHIPQNYFQKIQLLFASGLEPDVIFMNNQNIQMYINSGLLEDLSPYFKDVEKNFYTEALNCFLKKDKLYAIPRDISNLVIYYNKDIFKQQNIKIPDIIKNIFELREIAKKVTTKNNFGINFEENPLFWLYYLSSNGGGILSDDCKNIIINDEKSITALNLYAEMINKDHSVPSKAEMGSMTSAQMFINGKLAMYLSGRWMTPKFRETIKFDWDITEFPAPNKVYIDSSGWAVSKHSKHKNEAVNLIKYLSSTEAGSNFANSGLIIPADKMAQFQSDNQKPENYLVFKTMLKNTKPTPVIENYSAVLDVINEKTEDIFSGKKRAEKVFDNETVSQLQGLI